jgi:hypothetical protein
LTKIKITSIVISKYTVGGAVRKNELDGFEKDL